MPKVLVLGDGGSKTGFARVTRGVCDYLHQTGRWDVELRAVNWRPNHKIPYEYEVLPAAVRQGDPFGFENLKEDLQESRPDVTLMVQDLWNLAMYSSSKPPELPAVAYFPVDCPNLKPLWGVSLGAFSQVAAYTQFGAQEAAASVRRAVDAVIEDATRAKISTTKPLAWVTAPMGKVKVPCRMDRLAKWQNTGNWNIIPHGLDVQAFKIQDKAQARKYFGIPEGAFVVGSVNTNQFRKRQDLTMRAFTKLLRKVPDALLVIHCLNGEQAGWDLVQLADHLGISKNVVLVHRNVQELEDEQLVTLYNTMDVHLNTSGGEGWGLTCMESAACGVPQVVPAWSATRELWAGYGDLIPVAGWRYETKGLNTAHCEIDVDAAGDILTTLAQNPSHLALRSAQARERAEAQLSWDRIGHAFETLLLKALEEATPTAMSTSQVENDRVGEALSELQGVASIAEYRTKYTAPAI